MIISMSDVLCVTSRALCEEDFLLRIEKIAKSRPAGIILREKDLSERDYIRLAADAVRICGDAGVMCILHGFPHAAEELGVKALHMPLSALRAMDEGRRKRFDVLGASCHSIEDAIEAQRLGCSYITAGHIFDTACKQGMPGRGIGFLSDVCAAVHLPVYAIGGITPERMPQVRGAGAAGACVMSALMRCKSPSEYLKQFALW